MLKTHLEIRCPNCGHKIQIAWPTTRARHAELVCPNCQRQLSVAEASERAVTGARDRHGLHIAEEDEADKPSH